MYAQQLAWLDAVPEKSQGLSRRKVVTDPAMPPIHYGRHLFGLIGDLMEVSHVEIDKCPTTKDLPDWEKVAIIKIKKAHENMSHKARKQGYPAPYITEESAINQFEGMWQAMKRSVEGVEGQPIKQKGTV